MAIDGIDSKHDLNRIKNNISTSYMYFRDNYDRFREFRKYVFQDTLNEQQRSLLRRRRWPMLECNVVESYVSRLLGEFAKHEPSINVSPSEGVPVNQDVIDTVEQHFRHLLHEADKNSFSYEIYKDTLSGGFSVAKIYPDYENEMSFHQVVFLEKCFDPCLCGFDPIARAPHKGDGHFSFEIFPMTDEDFKHQYPDVNILNLTYAQDVEGFNWSYKDIKNNKIILLVEYYEKKKQRTMIYKLADGTSITKANYKKLQKYWVEENIIEQIPEIVNKRWTTTETVCCYRLIENQIIEYYETDYKYLPHVFIDGNSINLSRGKTNNTYQMTRPYVYHAKGMQDLKNYSVQALANFLQTMVQSRFIIKKEAIPQEDDYRNSIKEIQNVNSIVVNAFNEEIPEQAIPEPIREVVNPGAPRELMGALEISDPTIQMILGSFASNLGRNDNDLSGKAVIETASVGNAASMPYVVSYLAGLTQIANIAIDLYPKYLIGKRQIPVMDKEGKKDYREINTRHGVKLRYEENALKVNVEAGVNFQVQKNQAVQQIIALMSASQEMAQFWNSEKGMKILSKNLTIYGADNLEEAVDEFMQQQQQQQQQAMEMQQQAMQNDPSMIKAQTEMMKVQLQKEQQQIENELKIAQFSIDKVLADAKLLEAEARVTDSQIQSAVRLEEAETSRANHSLDAAVKLSEIHEREHNKKLNTHAAMLNEKKLHHEMNQGARHEDTEV